MIPFLVYVSGALQIFFFLYFMGTLPEEKLRPSVRSECQAGSCTSRGKKDEETGYITVSSHLFSRLFHDLACQTGHLYKYPASLYPCTRHLYSI
jgi:hypothetical protein